MVIIILAKRVLGCVVCLVDSLNNKRSLRFSNCSLVPQRDDDDDDGYGAPRGTRISDPPVPAAD